NRNRPRASARRGADETRRDLLRPGREVEIHAEAPQGADWEMIRQGHHQKTPTPPQHLKKRPARRRTLNHSSNSNGLPSIFFHWARCVSFKSASSRFACSRRSSSIFGATPDGSPPDCISFIR